MMWYSSQHHASAYNRELFYVPKTLYLRKTAILKSPEFAFFLLLVELLGVDQARDKIFKYFFNLHDFVALIRFFLMYLHAVVNRLVKMGENLLILEICWQLFS